MHGAWIFCPEGKEGREKKTLYESAVFSYTICYAEGIRKEVVIE